MLWQWALTKVPWKTIILHGPTIVEAARTVYGSGKRPADGGARPGTEVERLRRAVERLEEREMHEGAAPGGMSAVIGLTARK